jgi:hypothetical protein
LSKEYSRKEGHIFLHGFACLQHNGDFDINRMADHRLQLFDAAIDKVII